MICIASYDVLEGLDFRRTPLQGSKQHCFTDRLPCTALCPQGYKTAAEHGLNVRNSFLSHVPLVLPPPPLLTPNGASPSGLLKARLRRQDE